MIKVLPIFHDKNILLSVDESTLDFDLIKNTTYAVQFNKKDEFHITLVGSETSQKMSVEQFENIKRMTEDSEWEFNPIPEYFYISKTYPDGEIRNSIIQIVELPNLASYYEKINETLGGDIELPVPHVTLFTNSTNPEKSLRGIGVYSYKELESLSPKRLSV